MKKCTLINAMVEELSSCYPKTWNLCSSYELPDITPQLVLETMSAVSEAQLTRSPVKTSHVINLAAKWFKTGIEVTFDPAAVSFLNAHKLLLELPADALSRPCYLNKPVHACYETKSLFSEKEKTSHKLQMQELVCDITVDSSGTKTLQILKLFGTRAPSFIRIPLTGASINTAIDNSGILTQTQLQSTASHNTRNGEMELINISVAAMSILNIERKNTENKYQITKNNVEFIHF